MLLNIIILKMHNFGWYDVAFDSACKTIRFCGTGLGNKRCSIYRHWGKCVENKKE